MICRKGIFYLMEKKVLIMLATYNGERFIEQQIESILKQTYTNFHLAIQDDGSTDATLDIIKKYSQKALIIHHQIAAINIMCKKY